MDAALSTSQKILHSYRCALRAQVAALAEFEIATAITEGSFGSQISSYNRKYFIRSPEFGKNDFGLLVEGEFPEHLTEDNIAQYAYLTTSASTSKSILPGDFKTIVPELAHNAIQWSIKFTYGQLKTCQVLIIATPKDPDYVAVIPFHYFRQHLNSSGRTLNKENNIKFILHTIRPLWTIHPLKAFPPVCSPFVLPRSNLGQAVAQTRAYRLGSVHQWKNSHMVVAFPGVPRPEAFNVKVLEPASLSSRNALKDVLSLHRAFAKESKTNYVESCDIEPMLGDCKMVHVLGLGSSHIEMKRGHCRLISGSRINTDSIQHKSSLGVPVRPIFTWKAQWDYLYTHIDGTVRALFVPRDRIPSSWWNDKSIWLDWPGDDIGGFQDYIVNEATDQSRVQDIEHILERHPRRAQFPIGIAPVSSETLLESDKKFEETLPRFSFEGWDSSKYKRGYGSAHHAELRGETYPQWGAEILIEICRARGKGLVLDLGEANHYGRYWLAEYLWSEEDISKYDETGEVPYQVWHLSPLTPIIPIAFLRASWFHGFEPWSIRSTEYLTPIIKSRAPSLVVCDLFPYTCARLPHSRFVLPSYLLPNCDYGKEFSLPNGLIDRHSVDEDDLLDFIFAVPTQGFPGMPGPVDDHPKQRDYVFPLKDILQAVVTAFTEEVKSEQLAA